MKFTFLIPIYLSRSAAEGWRPGDTVYDHPTPIDQAGTLVRTIESLQSIDHDDYSVIFVISAVCKELEQETENWFLKRWAESKYHPKNVYLFSHRQLENLKKAVGNSSVGENARLLDLRGYPQNRNAGLLAGHLINSDVVIWIDDDELVKDRDFLKKLREGFAQTIGGEQVKLITGACPEGETGDFIRIRPLKPWQAYWNKVKVQNEAFSKIIGTQPRWKKSPFSFGGLSAIHRDVYSKVPYDLHALRGEDMDYNMNSRMFGFIFFNDNTLEIRHLPLPRAHEQWQRVREDMLRYVWVKNKLANQRPVSGMQKITAEEFDPYPGYFLKDDLNELIFKSQTMLAAEYLAEGKNDCAREALQNIFLSQNPPFAGVNAFDDYCGLQRGWVKLLAQIGQAPNQESFSPAKI